MTSLTEATAASSRPPYDASESAAESGKGWEGMGGVLCVSIERVCGIRRQNNRRVW